MAAASTEDSAEELLHLKLAFLAREPPACVLALARKAGGGSITPHVQKFLMESCTGTDMEAHQNCFYATTILKRIISEVELSSDIVIDELYEELAQLYSNHSCCMPKDSLLNGTDHIYKEISFLSSTHDDISPRLVSVAARLSCSSNMLEGDTGCSLWPSSLFLSEFILSHPNVFYKRYCFELGSGVGLIGICLNYVGASKVILTDGDASTLMNMKKNMELNNLCTEWEDYKVLKGSKNKVECKYLSWENVNGSDLWGYQPDIVLGADIIYDPVCVPHLVRVLSMLLRRDHRQCKHDEENAGKSVTEAPVAYLATVVRNQQTFNCFVKAAADVKLSVGNITSNAARASFLPYMLSYDRSSVQLLEITLLP